MLPSRVLLQLCVLLVVFAASAASAAAPVYGPGEVVVNIGAAPHTTTQYEQIGNCLTFGGVLVPVVTDAVYMMLLDKLDTSAIKDAFGYMGASTMLSSSDCTTSKASLNCIWYWEQGRYAGAENALAFYRGNRDPVTLPGAEMISTTVGNYWRVSSDGSNHYPGRKMQRYGMLLLHNNVPLDWSDASDSAWNYESLSSSISYTFCAMEQSTTTPASTTSTTTTSAVQPNAGKGSGVSVPLVAGISVAIAVVVGVIIVFILCLPCCCGWCCFARPEAVATTELISAESTYDPRATASQRGDMSRANSFRSHRGDFDDIDNRSFEDVRPLKDTGSGCSSFRGDVREAEAWQDGYGMTSVGGSQHAMTTPGAYAALAPPPASVMLMSRPPVPPAHPPDFENAMVTQNNWQTWETPTPFGVYTAEPRGSQLRRRTSSMDAAF